MSLRTRGSQPSAGSTRRVVAASPKVDRLSRSLLDFETLLQWFSDAEAALIAQDIGVNTGTAAGRLVAGVFAATAEWEREAIAARTREGLKAARASGKAIGRPALADDPQLHTRIKRMRSRGTTLQAIANLLNEEGIPTIRGGSEWRPSSVQSAVGARRCPPRRRGVELPAPR